MLRLIALVGMVALATEAAADPCRCDDPWSLPAMARPAGDGVDAGSAMPASVPANARVFLSWGVDPSLVSFVKMSDGSAVAHTVQPTELPGRYWLVPSAPLEAQAMYHVTGPFPDLDLVFVATAET